jgi:transposase
VISVAPGTKVFLACQPIDLRNGFDGLAAKVQQMIGADPFSGQLFLFRGKRGDYLKCLYWDGTGLCLFAKRLSTRFGRARACARPSGKTDMIIDPHR